MAFNAASAYTSVVSKAWELGGGKPIGDRTSEHWLDAVDHFVTLVGLASRNNAESVVGQIPNGRQAVIDKVVQVGYASGRTPMEVADNIITLYNNSSVVSEVASQYDDITSASTAGRVVQPEAIATPGVAMTPALLAALRSSSIAQKDAGAYARTQTASVRPGNVAFSIAAGASRVPVDANGQPILPAQSGKNTTIILGAAAALAAILFLR